MLLFPTRIKGNNASMTCDCVIVRVQQFDCRQFEKYDFKKNCFVDL